MSTKYREDGPGRIFHISSRVNWRAWHLDDDKAKLALLRFLREAAEAYGVRVLAGVIMSNHLHLVVQSPPPALYRTLTGRRLRCRHFRPWPSGHPNASVIAQFMKSMRYRMSMYWRRELDLTGRFWETAYDARAVTGAHSLTVRIAYDHRNPVKVGMCRRPEDYPWSSAREWATGEPGRFPVSRIESPVFGADPDRLRSSVLELQGSTVLEELGEELESRLWCSPDDEAAWTMLLDRHGLPLKPRTELRSEPT